MVNHASTSVLIESLQHRWVSLRSQGTGILTISGCMCHQANVIGQIGLAICLPVPHGHGSAEVQLVQNHQVRLGLTYVIERKVEGRHTVVSSACAGG